MKIRRAGPETQVVDLTNEVIGTVRPLPNGHFEVWVHNVSWLPKNVLSGSIGVARAQFTSHAEAMIRLGMALQFAVHHNL